MKSGLDKLYQLHNKIFNESECNIHDEPLTLDDVKKRCKSEYKRIISRLPICIHEISISGTITSMNPAGLKMLGLTDESEVIGTKYLDWITPSDRDRISDLLKLAISGHENSFTFKSSNGKTFSSCFAPMLDDSGSVEKILGYTEDITEYLL